MTSTMKKSSIALLVMSALSAGSVWADPWDVTTIVENQTEAGTDSAVHVTINANGQSSSEIKLSNRHSVEGSTNNFQRGEMETYAGLTPSIDEMKAIESLTFRVGKDALKLDKTWIRNSLGHTYIWDAYQKIENGSVTISVEPMGDGSFVPKSDTYQRLEVKLKVRNESNAGTSNNVYVQFFDKYGLSSPLKLLTSDISRNETQTVQIDTGIKLGQIDRAVLVKSGKNGLKAEWLEVKPVSSEGWDLDDAYLSHFDFGPIMDGNQKWQEPKKNNSESQPEPAPQPEDQPFAVYFKNETEINSVQAKIETDQDSNILAGQGPSITKHMAYTLDQDSDVLNGGYDQVRQVAFNINGEPVNCGDIQLSGNQMVRLFKDFSGSLKCDTSVLKNAVIISNPSHGDATTVINEVGDWAGGYINTGLSRVLDENDKFIDALNIDVGDAMNVGVQAEGYTKVCANEHTYTGIARFEFDGQVCQEVK
ncbi:PLAT/LH2 domain-containing protein [Vibrio sagamiensis]|uniref:PLAT domain-containing protein n=1 Tax=Vibrio sagamiensis NBRC 104589 TaxID=1219064 RepID=A0A511QK26_9VIBR|nr:PLAT/LH2 domain-containing protein [Vibrio sagamiensis]PNQ53828.1 hypothetical protein C1141_19155 [Vibrio agarivorans]GEM76822.1 hypothetical protein VSA01S_29340 [Vibrio sagamiensis NBRC 104589]